MTPVAAAVLELIREININLLVARYGRDTNTDHQALNEARYRYDRARLPKQRRRGDA